MNFEDCQVSRIYNNGLLLVKLGILDSQLGRKDTRRNVTSVINTYGGILLLLKSELASKSAAEGYNLLWSESYLRWRSKNPGAKNGQMQTANYDEIKERISEFAYDGVDWDDFWKKLKDVHDYRNDVEHRYSSIRPESLKVHLAHIKEIVDLILCRIIGVDPADELGDEWAVLSRDASVIRRQEQERNEEFSRLTWEHPRLCELAENHICPECGYQIIRVAEFGKDGAAMSSTFKCGSCNKVYEYEDFVESILQSGDFDDLGLRMKERWLVPRHIGFCPGCGRYGYDADACVCYCCGDTSKYKCKWCKNLLTIDDIEASELDDLPFRLCSDCRYSYEKMSQAD